MSNENDNNINYKTVETTDRRSVAVQIAEERFDIDTAKAQKNASGFSEQWEKDLVVKSENMPDPEFRVGDPKSSFDL